MTTESTRMHTAGPPDGRLCPNGRLCPISVPVASKDLRRAFPAAPVCPRKSPPEPYRDRKLSAAEAVEKKPSKRLQPVRYGDSFAQADLIPPMNGYCGNWVKNIH